MSTVTISGAGAHGSAEATDRIPASKAGVKGYLTGTQLSTFFGTLFRSISTAGPKNVIINGGFNIWQRGTSFASIATGTYCADRWLYAVVGAAVHQVDRSTDVPTVAQAGRLYNYSLLLDCTTVDAAIAAGDFALLQQRVEGFNWLPLAQRACTLSFWVKATKTGIYCVSLGNSGADRSYVAEYTVNTTDTWEYKTVAITASPSAGTWDYTNGVGLKINFMVSCGSTYQTTAGTWQTGNFLGTANQVNATDNTANNFRLCGVQLEVGSTATEFDARQYEQELALCQRYYEISGVGATGAWYAAIGAQISWKYSVVKRTNPTVTMSTTTPTIADPGIANRVGSGSTVNMQVNSTYAGIANIDGFTGAVATNVAVLFTECLVLNAEL